MCELCIKISGKMEACIRGGATEFDEQKMFDTEDAQKEYNSIWIRKAGWNNFFLYYAIQRKFTILQKEKLQIIKKESKIILFGAGLSGRTILDYLQEQQIEPYAFCDNNPAKVGQILEGLSILSLEEVKESIFGCLYYYFL